MRIFFMNEWRCQAASSTATPAKTASAAPTSRAVTCHSDCSSRSAIACGLSLASDARPGSDPRSTIQPIASRIAVLAIALTTSTRLSIENMRLRPSAGFSLSSEGFRRVQASTGPTCRNSASTPTSRTGTISIAVSSSSVCTASQPMLRSTVTKSPPRPCSAAPSKACSRAPANAAVAPARTSQTSSTSVLVASLLFQTWPSLRASRSFFGVGCSVLSPPSFLSAMATSSPDMRAALPLTFVAMYYLGGYRANNAAGAFPMLKEQRTASPKSGINSRLLVVTA